jgi:hypothetical protein
MARVYEYDVFISYQRTGDLVPLWVRNHFYPRLSELLDNNLDRDVKVFFDENVRGGTTWSLELRSALLRSRILVPICSPKYFLSEVCLAEWQSMARREDIVDMSSSQHPQGLIYPVLFCDSKNFPTWAHQRRMQDFKKWSQPYEQFQTSMAYLDFHSEVGRIAEEIEEMMDKAPEWQPDWPVVTPVPDPPRTSTIPRF